MQFFSSAELICMSYTKCLISFLGKGGIFVGRTSILIHSPGSVSKEGLSGIFWKWNHSLGFTRTFFYAGPLELATDLLCYCTKRLEAVAKNEQIGLLVFISPNVRKFSLVSQWLPKATVFLWKLILFSLPSLSLSLPFYLPSIK